MNLMSNILLLSPLEGFKSYTYSFVFDNLVDNSWSTESLLTNFFISEEYLNGTYGLTTGLVIFGLFLFLSRFYIASSETNIANTDAEKVNYIYIKDFISVIIVVPFIFLFFSINSINYFYQIIFDATSQKNQILYFEEHTIFISFLKDLWSFITIYLFIFLFSSKSFANLRLFSIKPLDALSETVYKFSLGLFVNTLDLKRNHDVRHFQEYFIKMHAFLLFILGSNLVGIIPYAVTITSSFANTVFLAVVLFTNVVYTHISLKGINNFLASFLPPGCPFALSFLLVPLEMISYIFRPISLSIRLFANMMAGHTLLKVIGGFSWSLMTTGDSTILLHYLPFVVLFILTFLELGVAFIQSYIFVLLGYIYLRDIFAGH